MLSSYKPAIINLLHKTIVLHIFEYYKLSMKSNNTLMDLVYFYVAILHIFEIFDFTFYKYHNYVMM